MTEPNQRIINEKGEEHRNYFTVGQLAAYCNVTPRTVRRWLANGDIVPASKKTGNGWNLWSPEEAKNILDWWLSRAGRRVVDA